MHLKPRSMSYGLGEKNPRLGGLSAPLSAPLDSYSNSTGNGWPEIAPTRELIGIRNRVSSAPDTIQAMALVLDGNSEQVSHEWRKRCIFYCIKTFRLLSIASNALIRANHHLYSARAPLFLSYHLIQVPWVKLCCSFYRAAQWCNMQIQNSQIV